MKEDNLSSKMINGFDMIPAKEVKEFIRRVKLQFGNDKDFNSIIDELAGEELLT